MEVLHTYKIFNTDAAEVVVPCVTDIFKPESVIDVGCGIGTWLSTYRKYGAKKILGLDGDHVPRDEMLISQEDFLPMDLNTIHEMELDRFDLVNCLEVAEHLPDSSAQMFVDTLVSLSDVIVFSAALPGQLGQNHFNEQYPAYWRDLFANRGYVYLDAFRKKFWNNKKVDWWYRQNMFLVVKRELAGDLPFEEWDGSVWIVPDLYGLYVRTFDTANKEQFDKPVVTVMQEPTLRQFVRQKLSALLRRVRGRPP